MKSWKWAGVLGIAGLAGFVLVVVSCAAPGGVRREHRGMMQSGEPEAARGLQEQLRGVRQPAVLFVGNSYSFGVPSAFQKEAAARRLRVKTGHSTFGGWTLKQHAEFEGTLKKIRSGKWDVVVIQEHSQLPAHPHRLMADSLPAVTALADEVRAAGAVPVLYQTWGRLRGDQDFKRMFPDDTFTAMQQRLTDGYRKMSEAAGGAQIVPVGEAWAGEMRAGRGVALYQEDGSHPSSDGDALTARVFVDAMFGIEAR